MMMNEFQRLFGKRREIVEAIHSMTNEEAKAYLRKLAKERETAAGYDYNDSSLTEQKRDDWFVITFIRDEVNALIEDKFIEVDVNSFNGIWGLTITQKCRDYFEMEKEYERTMAAKQISVDARGNSGNLIIVEGNAHNFTQTVNNGDTQGEILQILNEMKTLLADLDDEEVKGDVGDDLDQIEAEVNASTRNKSKIMRPLQRIKEKLESIKNSAAVAATVAKLLAYLPKLADLTTCLCAPAIGGC